MLWWITCHLNYGSNIETPKHQKTKVTGPQVEPTFGLLVLDLRGRAWFSARVAADGWVGQV